MRVAASAFQLVGLTMLAAASTWAGALLAGVSGGLCGGLGGAGVMFVYVGLAMERGE